ncbi:TetR family transcriptional regulator [Rhizobium anhuiense]|uniref:TetR family transcriptional regulator n=1 Tax=Rhizobium anhuiense TaxID=1184720 RepID=A0ABX4IZX4_9HYPH|nr:TetR/AcrR family transcriptional regulator [Rhizobium anhuiense]PDS35072.1 TetR family transcriptional regulator [Rhizobium anhuiense]PDS41266.1 TetR family transcriptional regulator [Rhizobium anhuiense]PDS48458.1 TetR family transcriptional regulator [Rhizobium anhuiense]
MIDTKTELMVRAEDLVRGRGYSGFSYADLSEAVGIRKASIHHHFPTKELLVATVLRNYTERYATALVRIETHYKDALDRFDAYGRLYLTGVDKGLGCLCAALSAELETLPDSLRLGTVSFFQAHIAWIDRIYAEGLQRKEVNGALEAGEAARMVVASLEGALMMERLLAGRKGFDMTLSAIRKSLSPYL